MHKQFAVAALAVALCSAPALAQVGSPNTTPGAVTRVILIDIKPGRADAFWADMRRNFLPIWEQQRIENSTTVSSFLVRNQTVNPWR